MFAVDISPQICQMLMFSNKQVLMPPFYQLINQEERLLILTDVKDELLSEDAGQ